jgi:hypothetical protein
VRVLLKHKSGVKKLPWVKPAILGLEKIRMFPQQQLVHFLGFMRVKKAVPVSSNWNCEFELVLLD